MLFEGPAFIVAIVAICTGGWLINNWIRAKHGYPLEDEWGGKSALTDGDYPEVDRKVHLLTSENEQLTGKLSRLEERISVLERIATDKGVRLADEIESLR
jgi:hypothetical protein